MYGRRNFILALQVFNFICSCLYLFSGIVTIQRHAFQRHAFFGAHPSFLHETQNVAFFAIVDILNLLSILDPPACLLRVTFGFS